MQEEKKRIFKVVELTRLIKSTLESNVGSVWLEGEISNVRRPQSGHYYLTIKDEHAQILGVLFRGNQRKLNFRPEDGLLVRVYGDISVYERSGNYQIIIRHMEKSGKGALQEQFEKLKQKLLKEGLFDKSIKKSIPALPQHVGVVTSGTGAAIRDILNVISRRFPNLHLRLYPVKVQGREAATEIAEAISYFDSEAEMDVLIVGRGGGSLEDLWCFNEEIVARAIAGCQIPVISAVGHEIDFTISDFTADLRAPTPSAAAELVVGQKTEYENRITELGGRLLRALREEIINARNRLKTAEGSYVFREPGHMVDRYRQALEGSQLQMKHQLVEAARQAQQRMDDISIRMTHETKLWSQRCRQNLTRIQSQLNAYNPRGVLKRGYSLTKDSNGRIVRSPHDVGADDIIWTELSAGMIESRVVGGQGAGRNGPDSERQESRT